MPLDEPTMAVVPRLLDEYFHAVANSYRPDVPRAQAALKEIIWRCSCASVALAARTDIPK